MLLFHENSYFLKPKIRMFSYIYFLSEKQPAQIFLQSAYLSYWKCLKYIVLLYSCNTSLWLLKNLKNQSASFIIINKGKLIKVGRFLWTICMESIVPVMPGSCFEQAGSRVDRTLWNSLCFSCPSSYINNLKTVLK